MTSVDFNFGLAQMNFSTSAPLNLGIIEKTSPAQMQT
jgi:hypothetical protein